MTVLEMKDKRAELQEANRNLIATGKAETRKLNTEEDSAFNANLEAIKKLDADIVSAEETRKVDEKEEVKMTVKDKKMEKRFSLISILRAELDHKPYDPDFAPVLEEGRNELSRAGVIPEGNIFIPSETRAAIVTGQTTGTTAGGYAVQTDKKTVLPPLTDYLVLTKAGATYLTGLVGNVSIPTYSGTSVQWKGEVASATDGAGTWDKIDMNPKRLTAFVDVSRMFLLQDSVGAEQMLLTNIAKAIACKLEATILGVGAGSVATEPKGLFYDYYTDAPVTTSYTNVIGLETAVDTANALFGNCSYITHAGGLSKLRTTAKVSSSDSVMISDALSYPVYVSNGVAGATAFTTTGGYGLIFGNWSDLMIGQWGGYDLLVDPYTQAALGSVRIIVNAYFDAAAARTASFSALNIK